MNEKKRITIYCGAATDVAPKYLDTASEVGKLLAEAGVPVITGAGSMGLMGAVSNSALQNNGEAIGVIPQFMVDRGWCHGSLSRLHVTDSMHSRKKLMAELSSGAIALPGGIGTMEELMEIITWRQLGLYDGNIVILNLDNYYGPLLQMLDKAVAEGFMKSDHKEIWKTAATPQDAVELVLSDRTIHSFSLKFNLNKKQL